MYDRNAKHRQDTIFYVCYLGCTTFECNAQLKLPYGEARSLEEKVDA